MTELQRDIKPLPKNEINFTLPEVEHFTLLNGLNVYFIMKNKLPIIQISMLFDAGSKYDPVGKKGLANLFGMLVDEGAGEFDSLQLSDEFDMLGTHFSVNTTEDNIYFSLQSLTENFNRSAELFAKVLTTPHLKEKDFDRERRKIITRLLQLKDEPDEIADLVFSKIILGDDNPYAYPVNGYENDLESIDIKDVREFYDKFIHPKNATIIAVGDISKTLLHEQLDRLFSGWRPKINSTVEHKTATDKEFKFFIVDKKDAVQSEIRAGHIASNRDEKDYYAKTLVNMILGGQFTSRINLNLREKNGFTYGANSRFSYLKDSAFFSVSTSVNTENTLPAIKEIINELQGIRKEIKQEELDFAKSSLIRKFPANFETYRQIATNLTGMVIHKLSKEYFNNYIENISAVTLKHAGEIAEASILPEALKIVVVGDKDKLKPELEKAALGRIIEIDMNGNLL